ncbi:CdaR family transcriptional regulator [Alteribacter populi]|uniref:CdaR family transcriptional regulator n=1 Tax=Alteribacter populi TaxID=2011011 RepID=UPI000BBAE64C|nr:sugar diacid recognition domain-containing protein [Alteribacter populi]
MSVILSNAVAQRIVEEAEMALGHNINIMDSKGVIIASIDKKRIGTFHEGAKRVLETKHPVTIHPNEQWQGAKPGGNFPIFFEDHIIGVIGMTGDPQDIQGYGRIIQKMTEVMIKEEHLRYQLQLEVKATESFIQEWFLNPVDDNDYFRARAVTLGIDVDNKWTVVILEKKEKDISHDEILRQEQIRNLKNKLSTHLNTSKSNLLIPWRNGQLLLLHKENEGISLNQTLLKLANHHSLTIGIGRAAHGIEETRLSFQEAMQSLSFARIKRQPVVNFRDLGIESLIHPIPSSVKNDFVMRFFPFLRDKTHFTLTETLQTFISCEQSLLKTSESLHVHKNTLQYRLKKMTDLTGYDPRKFRDGILYALALAIIENEETDYFSTHTKNT